MRVYSACWNSKFRSSVHFVSFRSVFLLFFLKPLITKEGALLRGWERIKLNFIKCVLHTVNQSRKRRMASLRQWKSFCWQIFWASREAARRKNLRSWIKHPRSCWNEQTVGKEPFSILNPSTCRQRWCLSYFCSSLFHLLAFARFYIVTA